MDALIFVDKQQFSLQWQNKHNKPKIKVKPKIMTWTSLTKHACSISLIYFNNNRICQQLVIFYKYFKNYLRHRHVLYINEKLFDLCFCLLYCLKIHPPIRLKILFKAKFCFTSCNFYVS